MCGRRSLREEIGQDEYYYLAAISSNGCISSLFRVYYFITLLQVSAKQQDMEGKFAVVNRAVDILITYEHKLPERIQAIYDSMSGRWTNLKTKVGQAKQKIGPRIREESARISKVRSLVEVFLCLLILDFVVVVGAYYIVFEDCGAW